MTQTNPTGRPYTLTPAFCYGLLIIAYLLFIAFASFYLTDFVTPRRAARAGAGELFFLLDEFRLRWWNVRDISTNILLYMPLGVLVALYLASRDRAFSSGIHLWWGVILSLGVEINQAFIGRFSDATDVLSNGGGYLLGFYVARTSVQRFGVSPGSLLGLQTGDGFDRLNTLAGLRFAYVAIFLVTAVLPLDISVSMTQIYSKLQAASGEVPRLIVDPFHHFRNRPDFQFLTMTLLAYTPLAFLSSYLQSRRGNPGLLIPAFHCLLLAVVVEAANLFIQSGRSDIAVPVLSFVTGLAVAWLVGAFTGQKPGRAVTGVTPESQYLLLSMMLLYLVFLLAVSVSPYDFELSLRAIRDKLLDDSNILPFRLHFSARSISSAVDIVREFVLYVPLGALLALWLRDSVFRPSSTVILAVSGILGLGLATWVELMQLAVVGRYVDITDVLLATMGSVAGSRLAPLFITVEKSQWIDPGDFKK